MTLWQGLGAFTVKTEDLSDRTLDKFREIHGWWICPVIYGDNDTGPYNLGHLHDFTLRCRNRNITVGGWFNCWGGDPIGDAGNISRIAQANGLSLIILDLEASYQWPSGQPQLMPQLVEFLRKLLPNCEIGVTTNAMNNAMIWNGRTLVTPKSFYDLGIRVIPQWYSWLYHNDNAYLPEAQMRWLKFESPKDGNFRDNNAPKTQYRGVPLSYVHGVVEVTGLEGASLRDELFRLRAAQQYGYTKGFSLYSLENMPDTDFGMVSEYYGTLYG